MRGPIHKSFLIALLFFLCSVPTVKAQDSSKPLHVVLLLDSSGSMRITDPNDRRKLAAQAVVSLMSQEDRVSVIEFDSTARVLQGWSDPGEKSAIVNAVNRVGNSGKFTDFRAGLLAALEMMESAPEDTRKIVLLLTDGKMDPNPLDDAYAPYHLRYRLAVRGKDRRQIKAINRSFRERLIPVSRRIIETEIQPELVRRGIEVYSVGLGAGSDTGLLKYLAQSTSSSSVESHYFFARRNSDLVGAFLSMLNYWKSKSIIHTESGTSTAGETRKIFIDRYLSDVSFIFFTNGSGSLQLMDNLKGGGSLKVEGTHPQLQIYQIPNLAGTMRYKITNRRGKYQMLVVGRSLLSMKISGLKDRYLLGDTVSAEIRLEYNGRNATEVLSGATRMTAVVSDDVKAGHVIKKYDLSMDDDGFRFAHRLTRLGGRRVEFILHAYDRNGVELLPRPSKTYRFKVLPDFYVEPEKLILDDAGKGELVSAKVLVHSRIAGRHSVRVSGRISGASRCSGQKDRLPEIVSDAFEIAGGSTNTYSVNIRVPEDGCWGDFEGIISFSTEGGWKDEVLFRLHVPSIWEYITNAVIVLLVVAVLLMVILSILWGTLKHPAGIIIVDRQPDGEILPGEIYLSRVKKGFITRWLNWRRNMVKIGSGRRTDIQLESLPDDFTVTLYFFRFVGDYIRNESPKDSGHVMILVPPDIDAEIRCGPGSSYRLESGLKVKLGDYELIIQPQA